MTTISITKENVLELIKKDTCGLYDYINYKSLTIDVGFTQITELKEYDGSSQLYITPKDLSALLFDRVVKVNEELLITVS